jgi:ABC-type sulfate transport system permease component
MHHFFNQSKTKKLSKKSPFFFFFFFFFFFLHFFFFFIPASIMTSAADWETFVPRDLSEEKTCTVKETRGVACRADR